VHHGREDEARGVLARLRGLDESHELVELEFLEIRAQSLWEKRTVEETVSCFLSELPFYSCFITSFLFIFHGEPLSKRDG